MKSIHVNTKQKALALNKMYNALRKGHAGGAMFVKYYLEGCPACVHFKPTWDKTAGMAKHKRLHRVLFVKINANMLDHIDLPKVNSFPTVKLFTQQQPQGIDFNEDRTAENLLHFIKQHTMSLPKSTQRRHKSRRHRSKQRTAKGLYGRKHRARTRRVHFKL